MQGNAKHGYISTRFVSVVTKHVCNVKDIMHEDIMTTCNDTWKHFQVLEQLIPVSVINRLGLLVVV